MVGDNWYLVDLEEGFSMFSDYFVIKKQRFYEMKSRLNRKKFVCEILWLKTGISTRRVRIWFKN